MSHCVKWRERLRPALSHWRSVMMFTLTLDQSRHDGPEAGLRYVQENRSIAKLIKKLKKKKIIENDEYTVTLEFHVLGWPHWHVLVEASYVCKHKLQSNWGLGHCWFSKTKMTNVEHAINYATKYIVKTNNGADDEKPPEFIFPDWVMDCKINLRRFSASRSLSKHWSRKFKPKIVDPDKPTRERITKTGRQKIEACGKQTNVLIKTTRFIPIERDGKPDILLDHSYSLVKTLDIPWEPEFSSMTKPDIIAMLAKNAGFEKEQFQNASFGTIEVLLESNQADLKGQHVVSQPAKSKSQTLDQQTLYQRWESARQEIDCILSQV